MLSLILFKSKGQWMQALFHMTEPSRLVSMHVEFEKAWRKFKPNHFALYYELFLSRQERADKAEISGSPKVFSGRKVSLVEVTTMEYFRADIIEEEISMALFRIPIGKPRRPAASLDAVIAFVERFPQIAREHPIVCTHTGIFFEEELRPQIVVIEYKDCRFVAEIASRPERKYLIDDLVISKKT